MGNIQREVVPFSRKSRRFNIWHAVKRISIHQPAMPQWRNSLESGMGDCFCCLFSEDFFALMGIV